MPSCWSSDVCSRSEEHTSELQSHDNLVCRLLLEKKNTGQVPSRPAQHRGSEGQQPSTRATSHIVRSPAPLRPAPPRSLSPCLSLIFFFFNDRAPPEIYSLPLHAVLPI